MYVIMSLNYHYVIYIILYIYIYILYIYIYIYIICSVQLNLIVLCSAKCEAGGRLLSRLTHLQASLLHWPSTSWA